MDGVGDCIDRFPAESGTGHGRIAVRVADFATRIHRRVEGAQWELFESCAHLSRQGKRVVRLRFDARVALAMVVVHFVGFEAAQQAREMIQAMAVVAADAGIEGARKPRGVSVIIDRAQQRLPLRIVEARSDPRHRRADSGGRRDRCSRSPSRRLR